MKIELTKKELALLWSIFSYGYAWMGSSIDPLIDDPEHDKQMEKDIKELDKLAVKIFNKKVTD